MSCPRKRKGGRPPTSARKYFSQIEETDDMKCQIVIATGKICGEIVKGGHRWGGNLKQHLTESKEAKHVEIRKLVDGEDLKSTAPKNSSEASMQSKLTDHMKLKPYPKNSNDYSRITDAVALF